MIKTVPTLGRIAIMAIFALSSFSACLYLWMAFGGSSPMRPKSYEVHIAFEQQRLPTRQGRGGIAFEGREFRLRRGCYPVKRRYQVNPVVGRFCIAAWPVRGPGPLMHYRRPLPRRR